MDIQHSGPRLGMSPLWTLKGISGPSLPGDSDRFVRFSGRTAPKRKPSLLTRLALMLPLLAQPMGAVSADTRTVQHREESTLSSVLAEEVPPAGTEAVCSRIDDRDTIESPQHLARLKSESAHEALRLQLQQRGFHTRPLNNIVVLDGWWDGHEDKVMSIINSPQDGLVPTATIRHYTARNANPPPTEFYMPIERPIPYSPKPVRNLIEDLNRYTDWIAFLIAQKRHEGVSEPWVVNMSLGVMLSEAYDKYLPGIRDPQRKIDFVDEAVRGPAVQEALAEWVEITRLANEAKIFPVIAIGNSHCTLEPGLQASIPDWQINMLGWSPYVVRVAAADENRTPTRYDDDRAAPYSSRGARWRPTLTLSGSAIPLASMNERVIGTSFVNPMATTLLALKFSENPDLTLADVERQAAESSLPNGESAGAVGPGILLPHLFLGMEVRP